VAVYWGILIQRSSTDTVQLQLSSRLA